MFTEDQISVHVGTFAATDCSALGSRSRFSRYLIAHRCRCPLCGYTMWAKQCVENMFTEYCTVCRYNCFKIIYSCHILLFRKQFYYLVWSLLRFLKMTNCKIDFCVQPLSLSLIKGDCVSFQQGGVLQSHYKRLHETARSITVKVFKPCRYKFRLQYPVCVHARISRPFPSRGSGAGMTTARCISCKCYRSRAVCTSEKKC